MENLLQSIRYDSATATLVVVDQLKLPHAHEHINIIDSEGAWSAIRLMQVRGAPLIAIVAALGIAVDATRRK